MSYPRPRQSRYQIRVGRSAAGLGLFTTQPIPKGKFVVEYFGPRLKNEAADRKSGRYLFALDKYLTIDGSSRRNLARYINHSCRPNSEVEINGRRLFVYSKRNIKAGEEITYHYGREYFDGFIKPSGCRCGHHA